ncbi:MAG TPA: AMED_5909 family protein [Actinokineospora sp.]|jgi:hypothetical protein|nr:AMED_5909 family protein [Actinokineospora sp.]
MRVGRARGEIDNLGKAHEALAQVRPLRDAPAQEWLAFRQLSVRIYLEIADLDRGHHHEARYHAAYEKERIEELRNGSGASQLS